MSHVPADSRALLESAERMLISGQLPAKEIVMMIYQLGRVDGRMEQLDRIEEVQQ